ncbi:MAG: VPLPA-CTERM-specific exosortase XrtD, partial [bacterium]
ISSQIGVAFIRLFGISVYLEGNVIDLGVMKLQVVEACSGLRYLFPLMTLAFMMSLFFRVAWWKRAVLFLSSIPVTVLMNSFRIGAIGVLVDNWGVAMAEGFLHDFEGWVVFMAAFGVLIVEMWLLAKIGRKGVKLADVFSETSGEGGVVSPSELLKHRFALTTPYLVLLGLVIPLTLLASALPNREEVQQQRDIFADFPMQLGEWQGYRDSLDGLYLDALDLDDYVLADYRKDGGKPVNFYVAWYDSQRKGESAHSPKSCLPGGGWRMTDFHQVSIPVTNARGEPHNIEVNRTLITKQDTKQLVYYWFQQRGRDITNEYLVKWFLFWDSMTRNRTDGALVRLTTVIKDGDTVEEADQRMRALLTLVAPKLDSYIPD